MICCDLHVFLRVFSMPSGLDCSILDKFWYHFGCPKSVAAELRLDMAVYGCIRLYMVAYDCIWPYMAANGCIWL